MAVIAEVRVQKAEGIERGEPAFLLFQWPQMRIHEHGVEFLNTLAFKAPLYQRSVAYSISHWLNYCQIRGLDYKFACRGDLTQYKAAMYRYRSEQTSAYLKPGTIAQRIRAVCGFYNAGITGGWNLVHKLPGNPSKNARGALPRNPVHAQPLRIDNEALSLAPKVPSGRSDIRVMQPFELRLVLDALGPSEEDQAAGSTRKVRDRIIAEWLLYTGLRIEEALGGSESTSKISVQLDDVMRAKSKPDSPYENQPIRIVGKFSKARTIAVPNWLLERTKSYVREERAFELGSSNQDGPLFLNSAKAGSKYRGKGISIRRYQAIFADACKRVGLVRSKGDNWKESTPKIVVHSCHDFRHTYAVMEYFAEVAQGNSEPWKKIQGQLGHSSLQTTIDTYLQFVSIHTDWRFDLRLASARNAIGLKHV